MVGGLKINQRDPPNKFHEAGIHIFCKIFPKTFGQFLSDFDAGDCATTTQAVTGSSRCSGPYRYSR
jgi:hypothetical protein